MSLVLYVIDTRCISQRSCFTCEYCYIKKINLDTMIAYCKWNNNTYILSSWETNLNLPIDKVTFTFDKEKFREHLNCLNYKEIGVSTVGEAEISL